MSKRCFLTFELLNNPLVPFRSHMQSSEKILLLYTDLRLIVRVQPFQVDGSFYRH